MRSSAVRITTPKNMFAPAARTLSANGNSSTFDCLGYDAVTICIIAGTWTDGTHAFKLQESDDDSTYSDVASTDAIRYVAGASTSTASFASITSSGTAVNQKMAYIGKKRYVQVTYTASGTTTGAVFGVVGIGQEGRNLPLS